MADSTVSKSSLHCKISLSPGTEVNQALWKALIGQTSEKPEPETAFSTAYVAYCTGQYQLARTSRGALCVVNCYQDLIDIIDQIKAGTTFEDIQDDLLSHEADPLKAEEKTKLSIWLAARLLSMHQIGQMPHTPYSRSYIHWSQGSLQQCLQERYESDSVTEDKRFEPYFNVVSIERLANLKVVWTDNLADHLSIRNLEKQEGELKVFHHATWLQHMRAQGPSELFPPGFLQETLDSLALLFPKGDRKVAEWLKSRRRVNDSVDDKIHDCLTQDGDIPHQLGHFNFWKERISILKQSFDIAEPGSLRQWWIDDRHKVQWATFWTAVLVLVLTIVFGIVQCIEGGMQVYLAYEQTKEGSD